MYVVSYTVNTSRPTVNMSEINVAMSMMTSHDCERRRRSSTAFKRRRRPSIVFKRMEQDSTKNLAFTDFSSVQTDAIHRSRPRSHFERHWQHSNVVNSSRSQLTSTVVDRSWRHKQEQNPLLKSSNARFMRLSRVTLCSHAANNVQTSLTTFACVNEKAT